MKKLRMITTSAIVLAIVSSAFSFKVKRGAYCVVADSAGTTNCTTYLQNVMSESTGAITHKYFPCWTFDKVECTTAIGKCTAQIRLATD